MNKLSEKNTREQLNSSIKTESLSIFNKLIKNNSKLIPFKVKRYNVGATKYFPPFSKEWKNSIYAFNFNNLKNLPMYNININTLIKHYFNLYFNPKFINNKITFSRYRRKRISLNKIFISKAEIKHTNSKAIITIYTYNREKLALLKRIRKIKNFFYKKFLSIYFLDKLKRNSNNNNITVSYREQRLELEKILIIYLRKELRTFRRFKLKLSLNKYKFEQIFLDKLSELISAFYNKKVEFNLINLKSIVLNTDLFTKILSLKLKNRKARIIRLMNIILKKITVTKSNRLIEKSRIIKKEMKNEDLIFNKYEYLNIISNLGKGIYKRKNKLTRLLIKLYPYYFVFWEERIKSKVKKLLTTKNKNTKTKRSRINNNWVLDISNIIFRSIRYKNAGGIRLEIKGRLTRRYRADRALFKVRWKRGLKNIDSSFRGLSTVNLRGFVNSNVEHSMYTSKRRIGAFAVKGWISGK